MRKITTTLLTLMLCATASVHAQYTHKMNFQGKLYSLGLPVTGYHVLEFYVGPLSFYYEKDTVYVNNGMYQLTIGNHYPIPANFFDSANATRQMIVKYDGNIIDTVNLYAPMERDPNLRGYIRDSIGWNNIHNKPNLDMDSTNELQTLSVHGDTLLISKGNSVIIPILSDTSGTRVVNGNFTVIDTAVTTITVAPASGASTWVPFNSPQTGVWQSFKAIANGKLRYIIVNMECSMPNVLFSFYSGQGPNVPGSITYVSSLLRPCHNSISTPDTIDLSDQNIILSSGKEYTFLFIPQSGGTITAQVQTTNPYHDGIEGSYAQTTSAVIPNYLSDLVFSIGLDNSSPSCLTFGSNCYVGIGTNNPTSQLEVKGRIKDQSGFVMPVGTIMAYGGRINSAAVGPTAGWLICDGRPISRTDYPDLFDAIDTSWGKGDGATTFNLPDLRGVFLRGVDSSNMSSPFSSGRDPDVNLRTAMNIGGNVGNNVGSYQGDDYKAHNHQQRLMYSTTPGSTNNDHLLGSCGSVPSYSASGTYTLNSGSSTETRPKNAAVYYIIKY